MLAKWADPFLIPTEGRWPWPWPWVGSRLGRACMCLHCCCTVLLSRAPREPGLVTAPLHTASCGHLCLPGGSAGVGWAAHGCTPAPLRPCPEPPQGPVPRPVPGVQALGPSIFHVDVTSCVCPQTSRGRFQPRLLCVSVSACGEGLCLGWTGVLTPPAVPGRRGLRPCQL